MAYVDEVLADAPVGYWRMDEGGGATALDSSGNGRNGTYVGGVTPAVGIAGSTGSALLNGTTGYINVPDNAAFAPSVALTVEAWVYLNAPWNAAGVINRRTTGNVGGFTMEGNPAGINFYVYIGSAFVPVASTFAPSLGVWHHLVGVYTSGRHELWIDGVLAASAATTGAIGAGAGATFEIGRNCANPTLTLGGYMDEVAFYATALSAARIQAHYKAGTPYALYPGTVLADSPVAYWRLGETSGTTAFDSGGGNYHGTYSGVTLNQPGTVAGNAAARFSVASSSLITVPHAAVFDLTGDLTLETWVKLSQYSSYPLLLNKTVGAGATNNTFNAQVTPTGNMLFVQYTSAAQEVVSTSTAPVPLGTWVHLAYTKAGTSVRLYLNGKLLTTQPMSATGVTTGTSPLYIGTREDRYSYMDGLMDEVAVYNRALSQARIQAHVTAGAPYAGAVMADAPLGYWRLGEASGTTAYDSSGNANHASQAGGTITRGQPGAVNDGDTAMLFPGTGSAYFNTPALTAQPGVGNRWTLEAWIKTDAWAAGHEFIAWAGSSANYLTVVNGQATFSTIIGGAQNLLGYAPALPVNTWIHLVGTWDGTTKTLYINGSVANYVVLTGVLVADTNGVRIGDYDGTLGVTGLLDEVAVYNTALTAARVDAHYRGGRASPQRWDGVQWVPFAPQRWDGTQWVPLTPRRWDGTVWV